MIEQHYTTAEVCDLLSISEDTLLKWVADGEIESVRRGRVRRYPESSIQAFLEKNREHKPTATVVRLPQRRQTRTSTRQGVR